MFQWNRYFTPDVFKAGEAVREIGCGSSTYGKNDITPYIVSNTDFFITSIPMEKSEIPVIDVSPLLNETDMERIRRMVYQYERMPAKKEEETFFDELTRIHQIAVQIRTVIEHLDIYEEDSAIGFQQLVEQIAKRCSPYQDRQEKIYADIMRREEIATQVYAEFGFALLHNRSEGVVRPTLAVCLPGKCEKTEFTSAERAREAFEETKRANTDFEEMKHGPNDSMKPEDIRFTDPYMKGISAVFVMLVPVDEHLQINNEDPWLYQYNADRRLRIYGDRGAERERRNPRSDYEEPEKIFSEDCDGSFGSVKQEREG